MKKLLYPLIAKFVINWFRRRSRRPQAPRR
jgi:hypothetical protein